MKTLTPKQALELIKRQIAAEGSQRAFAAKHQLSATYVSDTVTGRRDPSNAILTAVGLSKVIRYSTSSEEDEN